MRRISLVCGNPPYVNGTQANSPIFHKIIMRTKAEFQTWVIPCSWFHSDLYIKFRDWLFANGLYKIRINRYNVFNATVATCVIYLRQGYIGPITVVPLECNSYEYDYRRVGYVVIADTYDQTDRIIKNKPLNPYTLIDLHIDLKKIKAISDIEIKGWRKIVTKITRVDLNVDQNDFLLLTSDLQGKEAHSLLIPCRSGHKISYSLLCPVMLSESSLNWWRMTRFAVIEPGVLFFDKYFAIKCTSQSEAEALRDYLKSDYVTGIQKHTRSKRNLGNSQLKFIPRLEDVSVEDYTR